MIAPEPIRPTTLPLAQLREADNPRRYFDPAKHAELVASLKLRGLLQPVLVRPIVDSAEFKIVAGGRRYRAALEAFGADGEIPVIVRDLTDQEALEAAIDENDVRDDASETEQADAAVRVLAACQGDKAEAAARLGWSAAKLERRLALANLSATVKTALDERRIKVGHAELLAAVPGDKQDKALDTILSANLDVGKTRELLMRVMQDLANATFDKAECAACPFNSAVQGALFGTHVDDGHCTNGGCFQLKLEAADAARREEEERAAAAKAAEAPVPAEEAAPIEPNSAPEAETLATADAIVPSGQPASAPTPAPAAPTKPAPAAAAPKVAVTAKSIAARFADVREAAWRSAVARALVANPEHGLVTVLTAAMSGTLSQIRPETLTARAALLVGEGFEKRDYNAKLAELRELPSKRASDVLAAIGAAYAKDVPSFDIVTVLAFEFDVDLRASWQVDQEFLERCTNDELKFVAQECGLVAHMGTKPFANLLKAKRDAIIAGMLNATGFAWAGRVPSAMALDGKYGPPPTSEPSA
jgi:ParB/RepB/Spo0J family partition protein